MKEDFQYFVAPGRINIIGEHTDYNDGYVMPAAIDRYVQLGIKPVDSKKIKVSSQGKNSCEFTSDELKPEGTWCDYVKGVFYILKKQKGIDFPGFEIEIKSNVPEGAGLSSSAALEVATITALNEIMNLNLTDRERYEFSQEAENEFVGVKCGVMDQFASVMGKENSAIFLDTRSMTFEYVPLELSDYCLLVIDSKVKHSLTSGDYNNRRAEANEALKELNKGSYRDLTITDILLNRSKITGVSYHRAMHVVSENERVRDAASILKHSNFENLGRFLLQSHESLAYDYEVSCEEIDYLVTLIRGTEGVTGGRIIGAGFGGSVLAICEKNKVDEIIDSLKSKYKEKFDKEIATYIVNSSDGAKKIEAPIL